MARIDPATLLPAPRIRRAVLEGDVTQLHRGDRHAAEGDVFEIDGVSFEVVEVAEERLGDLTDADARAEDHRTSTRIGDASSRLTTSNGTTTIRQSSTASSVRSDRRGRPRTERTEVQLGDSSPRDDRSKSHCRTVRLKRVASKG
ncbi:hypothetical protein VB779_08845 [Haloarculaceae archaeon H-GB11]|nr:hypothetical protein [Haloarculaceae archaeon H-GB11]